MRYTAFAAAFLGAASFLSAADPLLLNLVMPDAQIVAGVNVAKAKTSPFGQFILRQMPPDSDFSQFVNASGFDPRRDLQEVLMASTGTQSHGMVAARGTFDAIKIATLATADGKHKVASYNGAQLITATDPAAKQAVAFFDGNFAVAGDLDTVKAAVDRRKATNPVNPVLASKVAMYGAADAWTVSLVPLSNFGVKNGTQIPGPFAGVLQGDLLKKVSESSGGVTFNSPVQVTSELVSDTNQDAMALGDVVKFLASMIQTTPGTPGASVATLVQNLNVSTQGNVLKLALAIPEAQLESLIEAAKSTGKKTPAEKI